MIDSLRYRRFAEALAKRIGRFLIKRLGKIKKISYKGRVNLITDVDTICDKFITESIRKSFPDHAIISEESGRSGKEDSEYCWLIDPLDGTTNYAHSFGFFAVSIALLKRSRVITGVVYDPLRDELFSASRGRNARLNGSRIRVSNIERLDKALMATGFPYRLGKVMKRNIDNFVRFMMKAQAVRRPGSAALDLCYVACGRFDGFWELDLHPWDTAAGSLIIEEAGGMVSKFDGGCFSPFDKEIAATNKILHREMLKVLE